MGRQRLLVRLAGVDDVSALVDLSGAVQDKLTASGSLQVFGPIPPETVAAHVAAGSAFVLSDVGAPIGGMFVEPCSDAPVTPGLPDILHKLGFTEADAPLWFLQKLMIAPARQRGGLGRLLLDAARSHVLGADGGTLALDCWAGNVKLREFYTRAGFTLHGEYRDEGFAVAVFRWNAPRDG